MKNILKTGLLIIFMLAFSISVFAATSQNWEQIYPDEPNLFLDTNSVVKASNGNIAFAEKTVFSAPLYQNRASEMEIIVYNINTSMWRRYSHAYFDVNGQKLESHIYDLQTAPWAKVSSDDNVIKRVIELSKDKTPIPTTNNQPSLDDNKVNTGANPQGDSTITKPSMQNNQFPTTWNGLKLTESGTMPSKLSLDMTLATNAVIRGIIIKQPRTTVSDNGTLSFYFNNGDNFGLTFFRDQIGFWFSWKGDEWFDRAIWKNGLYKSSSYNSSVAFYVPGDGYLYVDVIPLNTGQSKSYKFALPEGAQYFNGKCRENVLIGEIGLYQ